MRAVDALMECLKAEGVDVIFGYPGGTIMPFYDALYGHPMRHILVRHEAGAALQRAATRTSGRVGVCCATSGPGATNLVTGRRRRDDGLDSGRGDHGQRAHAADGHRRFPRSRRLRDHAVHDQSLDPDHRSGPALHQSARSVRARAQRPAGSGAGRHPDRRAQSAVRAGAKSAAQGARRETGRDRRIAASRGRTRFATRTVRSRSPAAACATRAPSRRSANCARCLALPHTTTIGGLGASDPNDVHGLGMLGMHGTKARTSPCTRPTSCWRSACASTTASPASSRSSRHRQRTFISTSIPLR